MGKATGCHFQTDPSAVLNAALQAVMQNGWKVDQIDRTNFLLTFKTGLSWKSWNGQEMSLVLTPDSSGGCLANVTGNMNMGRGPQIYDWGEAGSIGNKLLTEISAALK